MKSAVVSSAQIGLYGRMDAAFHIAVNDVSVQADALKQNHSAADLLAKLAVLEVVDLKPLAPLLRAAQDRGRREDYLKAAAEYPFIAFALVRKTLDQALARAESELQARQAYVEAVRSLKSI